MVSDRWISYSDGTSFFDWGGFRYSVARVRRNYYSARKAGFTNTLIGYFDSLEKAQERVEIESGYRGRKMG